MGVSENVVYPIFPMVLLIIIPMKNGYFIGNINPTFSGPKPYGNMVMATALLPPASQDLLEDLCQRIPGSGRWCDSKTGGFYGGFRVL